MKLERTKGNFGFHLGGGRDESYPTAPFVQIYVMSSTLSRAADSAISAHLMTGDEVDRFVDEAISALAMIRIDAKKALANANKVAAR